MELPAPWVKRISRTKRVPYAFNTVSNESVWIVAEPALPAGWGWKEASESPDGKIRYIHFASGTSRTAVPTTGEIVSDMDLTATAVLPVLAQVPRDGEQPSETNVLFDVYIASYRAREPWRITQLAGQACMELAWWQAIAAGKGTRQADDTAAKRAEGTVTKETSVELIAAVFKALGSQQFASCWDPKGRVYVIKRELVLGYQTSGEEDPLAGAARGSKRARVEDDNEDRHSDTKGTGAAAGSQAVTAPARPRIRDPSEYALSPGSSLYTDPRFPANPVAAEIYSTGRASAAVLYPAHFFRPIHVSVLPRSQVRVCSSSTAPQVTTGSGLVRKISAAVGPKEHRYLYQLVRDNKYARCLEIGMANGLSALAICQAMKDNLADGSGPADAQLVSVDPFQSTQWDNAGRGNLACAGLAGFSRVIEEPSYLALPSLLRDVQSGAAAPFDCVLVDGMHLFDYTLVDVFLADLLCRVGGVVLVDDIRHRGVKPLYEYVLSNYAHLQLLPHTLAGDTMAAFHKVGQDARAWDFHAPFNGGGGR